MATEKTGLEQLLFTERREIGLSVVAGAKFHTIGNHSLEVPPLVVSNSPDPNYLGRNSGLRSALVMIGDSLIKYKGCAIGKSREGPYRAVHSRQPLGGSLLSAAKDETEITLNLNEILTQNGFDVPYEPLGCVDYGKSFEPTFGSSLLSHFGIIRQHMFSSLTPPRPLRIPVRIGDIAAKLATPYLPLIIALPEFSKLALSMPFYLDSSLSLLSSVGVLTGFAKFVLPAAHSLIISSPGYKDIRGLKENLGAAVMKVKGDTRLPEILSSSIKDAQTAMEGAYKLGVEAGAQKRVTEEAGFVWGIDNAHSGNLVVFRKEGEVHIGMIDFDIASNGQGKIDGTHERERLLAFGNRYRLRNMVDPQSRMGAIPTPLSTWFRTGFAEGLAEPERRPKLLVEELYGGFELHH